MQKLENNVEFIKQQKGIVENIINSSLASEFEVPVSNYVNILFEHWAKNKQRVFETFGNRTCIVSKVFNTGEVISVEDKLKYACQFLKQFKECIYLDRDSYKKQLDFIAERAPRVTDTIAVCMSDDWYCLENHGSDQAEFFMTNFILANYNAKDSSAPLSPINLINSIIDNKLYFNVYDKKTNKKLYNKGMKFSKFLLKMLYEDKNLYKEEEEKNSLTNNKFYRYQVSQKTVSEYSRFRQHLVGKKVRACISILPADYFTVSDNNENWTSCHSMDDGCYCFGNMNYFTDNCTFVAYVIDEKDYFNQELENFYTDVVWNSKKWRLLGHLNYDNNNNVKGYYLNKNYPYHSALFTKLIDDMLCEVIGLNDSNSKFQSIEEYRNSDNKCVSLGYKDNTIGYLDISRWANSDLVNIRAMLKDKDENHLEDGKVYKAIIGGYCPCKVCGEDEAQTDEGYCLDCEDSIPHCCCCGERIDIDDDYYMISEDGDYYCEDCSDEHSFYCDYCGESHLDCDREPYMVDDGCMAVCELALEDEDSGFFYNEDGDLVYQDPYEK